MSLWDRAATAAFILALATVGFTVYAKLVE